MVDSSASYKKKYLQALESQEQIEKQTAFQLDLMRKMLVYLSSASQGLDMQLDATLVSLRDKMRGASGAQVVDQMERVQQAVTQFERARDSENNLAAKRVSTLIQEYLTLQIPNDISEKLITFDKSLKKKLSSYRHYPQVLDELAKLQHHALVSAQNPPESFWQRMRGGKTLKNNEEQIPSSESIKSNIESRTCSEVANDDHANDNITAEIRSDELMEHKVQIETDEYPPSNITPHNVSDTLINSREDRSIDEDSYEQVSMRIANTLANLIDRIEPNDLVKHKVDIVRSRIKRGMDWFTLAVTLEDIHDILMLRYLQADKEFAAYLKRVSDELNSIRQTLITVVDNNCEQSAAAAMFSDTVTNQVENIKKNMSGDTNITQLKSDVTECLSVIHSALNDFSKSRTYSDSVNDELLFLMERVKTMESESEQTKKLLEEERRRATHDSLTELPNREAYNERAYAELQRFKRYGRPLTLAVCDIDFFKRVNDTYGHQAGDKVLKLISSVVASRLRSVDFVGRYGGEEFIILMPETDINSAYGVLDKIRASIAKTPFHFKDEPLQITLSFGLASFQENDTIEDVFTRADEALYGAKSAGRNQCLIAKDDNK